MYQITGPNRVQISKKIKKVALFVLFTLHTSLTCNYRKVGYSQDHSNQKLSLAKKTDAFSS